MRNLIFVSAILFGFAINAEEKVCTVKGMHCTGCVEMVKEAVCTDQYAACDVKIKDAKKEIGEIHVKTKAAAKVDEKAMSSLVAKTSDKYKLESCKDKKITQ